MLKQLWKSVLRWFLRQSGGKQAVIVLGLLILLGVIIGGASGGGSKSNTSASPPPPSAPAKKTIPKKEGKARFVLVVRQSACGEDPSTAYINCHVAVRNAGTAPDDDPHVYVLIRYSDGGSKIIDNTTDPYAAGDEPGGFKILPHTTRVVYLQHSYNAQSHNLVQAAAGSSVSGPGKNRTCARGFEVRRSIH